MATLVREPAVLAMDAVKRAVGQACGHCAARAASPASLVPGKTVAETKAEKASVARAAVSVMNESGGRACHAGVAQQSVHRGLSASKSDEVFHRVAGGTAAEDLVEPPVGDGGIKKPFFLKRRKDVC